MNEINRPYVKVSTEELIKLIDETLIEFVDPVLNTTQLSTEFYIEKRVVTYKHKPYITEILFKEIEIGAVPNRRIGKKFRNPVYKTHVLFPAKLVTVETKTYELVD